MDQKAKRKASLQALFASRASTFARCFEPRLQCDRPAIRAHSIQNAGALELLAEDGHVITPALRIDAKHGPSVHFDRVGRNKATTFAGLCAMHDTEIFAPIEKGSINLTNTEHQFLLAYRAAFYEVHATVAAAAQVQEVHLKRVEADIDPKDVPTPHGIFALERMYTAWLTYQYKANFDEAYLEQRFDDLVNDVLLFDVEEPTLAASALFSLGRSQHDDNAMVGVCVTVLPVTRTQTAVLLSYLPRDAERARAELGRVLSASGVHQKYEVSRLLLSHCQNFVLSPSFVASWSTEKRTAILDLFTRTIFDSDLSIESEHLMLFR